LAESASDQTDHTNKLWHTKESVHWEKSW